MQNSIKISSQQTLIHFNSYGKVVIKGNPSPLLKKQILEYFQGKRKSFSQKLIRIKDNQSFSCKVLKVISQIPYGETLTYGQVAQKAGSPKAARAVGSICKLNSSPILIPCHRVVAQNSLGGFAYGKLIKQKLLSFEKSMYFFQTFEKS